MRPLPRGLYAIADAAWGDPGDLALRAARAGCATVQVRAKGWEDERLLASLRGPLPELRATGVLLIINDSVEVAAALGADGVHLGQEDLDTATARSILGPNRLIGRSTHTPAQVTAAEDADYLGFGPVFPTRTKDTGYAARATPALAEACRATRLPVVAIGGIEPEHLPELRAAGAWGWAVIRGLWSAPDLAERVALYR